MCWLCCWLAAAATAAGAGALGFLQHARYIVLEADTLLLESGQGVVIEHFYAVFNAADALVQLFVLASNAGEMVVALTQFVQGFAQFREIVHQGVVFNMHGFELLGSDKLTLAVAAPGFIDPGQAQASRHAHGSLPDGWLHWAATAEVQVPLRARAFVWHDFFIN